MAVNVQRDGRRVKRGGEGGIRTPGPLRVNGFQDRRFKPLSHLSAAARRIADRAPG